MGGSEIRKKKGSFFVWLGKIPNHFTRANILTKTKTALFKILSPIITVLMLGRIPMDPQANISSGNWEEAWHEQLNAQIRKLIGKQETDVTEKYQIEKQKEEIKVLLQDFMASLSSEEKNKWDNIITKANWKIDNTEGLFIELNKLLSNKKTLFFYLTPPQSVFYLKREGSAINGRSAFWSCP